MMTPAILHHLQWQQRQHDIAYHSDIWQLPPARSLTHMTLHQAKYLGALSAALGGDDASAIKKTMTDAFIITLATANILNQDMTRYLVATEQLDTTAALGRYTQAVGRMAKACEAFDHAEDYPSRAVLAENNAEIFNVVMAIAAAQDIDLRQAYQTRMKAIEAKSVFNHRLGASQKTARTQAQFPRKPRG